MKTALLFSGQGSQYAGMGIKLQGYSVGKETFREANDTLGMDITHFCCNGTEDDLANTKVTQPAILTCSIAALRIWLSGSFALPKTVTSDASLVTRHSSLSCSATAGLSVGEYSALVASEVLSFADALRLVSARGRLMAEAAALNPGMMVAILGLETEVVESICKEASSSGVVGPANYNCPGQVVISGEEKAVRLASELAEIAGAKRCVALNVSGAFHSTLMRPAETSLRKALDSIPFSRPRIPFVANVTGNYVEDPAEIIELLAIQLSNPIQWEASIRRMMDDGIDTFLEVGPGKILANLVRRIYKEAKVSSTDDMV